MPNIDLSILNQRATPAFFADTLANRPAAGFIGRIFVSTDTYAFYRDNGTGWDLIGGPGTGTITGTGASGQIALWNGASTITGDTGLTYDGTANSLTADKFIVSGGTSSQFLKANGSVDSNSYVPYTGANASLNMGANNLLGQNYFINGDNVSSGGYLGIKQFNGSSGGSNGYTSISALQQNSLYFQFSQTNGTNKIFELSTALLGTTTRQFLLPDADGTLALTSNVPSVSGAVNQVAFFNGANSIIGENNLFWDSTNDRLGINTNTPGAALDLHSTASTLMQLNQTTATNDSRIAFQNSGTALWRIGNFYNSGANDWGIFDVVGAAQPFTIKKTTGQTFIGAETTTSGRLVVNNATGDNHIVVIGATAPSIRINNAGSGATRQIGIGLATTTNNFIQGATGGEMAIFNSNTTASPILFGIYDAGLSNTQEAARISAARNFLIGTTTDNGSRLQVSGAATFSGGITSTGTNTMLSTSSSTAGLIVRGGSSIGTPSLSSGQILIGQTSTYRGSIAYDDNTGYMYIDNLYDNANSNIYFRTRTIGTPINALTILGSGNVGIGTTSPTDKLVVEGSDVNVTAKSTSNISVFKLINTSGTSLMAQVNNALVFEHLGAERMRITSGGDIRITSGGTTNAATLELVSSATPSNGSSISVSYLGSGSYGPLIFSTGGSEGGRFAPSRNLLLGTTTDNGNKLQVNGAANFQDPATQILYGGFAFFTRAIVAGVTTNFYQVPSANWAGITEISWTSNIDSNRSGAALIRWAYDIPSGTTGVVFTAYNNAQNSTATFSFSGGFLQINISGGGADYNVQFKIQGSRAN